MAPDYTSVAPFISHFPSSNVFYQILSSQLGSKGHESRGLGCLVLHSPPILPIMPGSEHTLNRVLVSSCLTKACLGQHGDEEKGHSVFQLRILQSW